jgi:hypothetical protein
VLVGTSVVFSGVFPRGNWPFDPLTHELGYMAHALGASITGII